MRKLSRILCLATALLVSTSAFSQVSNDNEDGVNKVDQHFADDFVPGQAIVKFKDDSNFQIHRNAKGLFRSSSVNAVNEILISFGVDNIEKLFPSATPKLQSKLRKTIAPNGKVVQESNLDKIFWVKTGVMSADSTMQLVESLKALPDVEYAEPNYYAYVTADVPAEYGNNGTSTPQKNVLKTFSSTETNVDYICPKPSNNPLYFRQYGITQQKINKLWDKPIINKKRPVIAILDTGVDINHPDLVDNIWTNPLEVDGETAYDDDGNGIVDDVHGWNFVDDYYDLTDRNGHGTHCAGIAAATDNAIGIVGANPQALIMPIKVLNDKGIGDAATIARGIVYAADNGADILSMSFGSEHSIATQALAYAYQTAILVASAGNSGVDIYHPPYPAGTMYPAAFYLVLGVEASGPNLQRAPFSNYDPDGPIYSEDGVDGRNYEIQVPGVDIYSTLPNGLYNKLSGTSMATPLFAGAVSALMMVKEYPSKDVLFGDLIHLKADFEKIYSDETPRMPKIDLVAMNVDDNVEGNDNIDGQVDIGETILFSPVLRNTWADATDIQLHLTVDPIYASFVEIENPDEAFGYSLSAYGRATAKTPIRVKFNNNIGDNTRIKFILEISYHESEESFTQDVYITVNNVIKIGGLISEDRTLTADHVYVVNENLGVMEGVTLTIEPGTRLEFESGKGLYSYGKLVANGTPDKKIVFTGRTGSWDGIQSHTSSGYHSYGSVLYTNDTQTLFTLLPTEETPLQFGDWSKSVYYGADEDNPAKEFYLSSYVKDYTNNMSGKQGLLTDPNYLTPSVLQMLKDVDEYCSQYSEQQTVEKHNNAFVSYRLFSWYTYDNPCDTLSYCIIENAYYKNDAMIGLSPYMKECVIKGCNYDGFSSSTYEGLNNHIINSYFNPDAVRGLKCGNIINTTLSKRYTWKTIQYSDLVYNNYFNNPRIQYEPSTPSIDRSETPSYLGTSRQDIALKFFSNGGTFGQVDLSNMPTRPYAEAHGVIWKVCVSGKDAQDEYENLAPLGVGRHKFEVYYNRPMNKAVAPQITFGVREPYTQQKVDEDGEWNEEGTIYTAYKTITGKTMSDGANRIYVQGGEDNEYFECPYEKTRFNIMINAAGSLATGFAAEGKMGCVELTWNNEENDFDDAMGFNIYRFTIDSEEKADTIRLNTEIVDIETTAYTDYDVTPGETYYYMYKVLSTDLQEYDASNVVVATPLTSTMGDANGSGEVDVADVITTVNYAAGMNPKPFIFEAADVNIDLNIDILDVVGIIQEILNPGTLTQSMALATATYTIEDGVVYVETPVSLAGVQVQLNIPEQTAPTATSTLNGFEKASAWLTDEDYIFLAYNMNGKTIPAGRHALLNIGDAQLRTLRLSDKLGGNVLVEAGNATAIEMQTAKLGTVGNGIYNLSGQKIAGSKEGLKRLPKGIYIVNGEKIAK